MLIKKEHLWYILSSILVINHFNDQLDNTYITAAMIKLKKSILNLIETIKTNSLIIRFLTRFGMHRSLSGIYSTHKIYST